MKTITRTAACAGVCLILVLAGVLASVGVQTISQGDLGSIGQAHAVGTAASAKRVKSSGWYRLDPQWSGLSQKGGNVVCYDAKKLKSGRGIKNGKMKSGDTFSMIDGRYLSGKLKFKTAKRVKYGKYTISGLSVGRLGRTKALSRSGFCKAANRKPVYWLLMKVKKGVVVEARWMPLSSVEMLD